MHLLGRRAGRAGLDMTRSYRKVRPQSDRVNSVEDVLSPYDICRNTLLNWVGSGLRPSDTKVPQIFRGAELKRFHEDHRRRARSNLRTGQSNCLGCDSAVFSEPSTVTFWKTSQGTWQAIAVCPDCAANVRTLLSETDRDKVAKCTDTNASRPSPPRSPMRTASHTTGPGSNATYSRRAFHRYLHEVRARDW